MGHKILPFSYQNPDASDQLGLNMMLISNTPDEEIHRNIEQNSIVYTDWLQAVDAHNTPAVLIAGGPSVKDHVKDIQKLQREGADVFAMNGASSWAHRNGIRVDYQVIFDSKERTSDLVDPSAGRHLFSSQCHPRTLESAERLTIWHSDRVETEDYLPEERVKAGGYVLVGCACSVGIIGLCVAYTQGYREMHCFGYDGSCQGSDSHAYPQEMNNGEPLMERQWGGRTFVVPMGIYEQAGEFVKFATLLKEGGCGLNLYGDGLIQHMHHTPAAELSEVEKYHLIWEFDEYKQVSPGEKIAQFYVDNFKPEGKVIDFGCGTGKGSIQLKKHGLEPVLIDFAPNGRIKEALDFQFFECDLTKKIPIQGKYGFCTDVMEHIPTEDVPKVIGNIMESAEEVFFQISLLDDMWGDLIKVNLHLTVKPHDWWASLFVELGYTVVWAEDKEFVSLLYITR